MTAALGTSSCKSCRCPWRIRSSSHKCIGAGSLVRCRHRATVRIDVLCFLGVMFDACDFALFGELQHVDAHSLGGGGLDIRGPGGWRLTGASSFIYSRLVRGKVITFLAATGVDVSSRTRRDSASEWSRMYAA